MPPRKRTKATEPVAEAVPVRMPAQGTGGIKRTPQSAFDPAKDKDVYEVEKIMGTRKMKDKHGNMINQFLVKWKGFAAKQNTWEPLAHLAGVEDMVAEFYSWQKQQSAEAEAEDDLLRLERQETMAAERQKKFKAVLAARAVNRAAEAGRVRPIPEAPGLGSSGPENSQCSADDEAPGLDDGAGAQQDKKARRSAPCWECFSDEGMFDDKVICVLPHPKMQDKVCGKVISKQWGSSGMWNHLLYCHKAEYQKCAAAAHPLCHCTHLHACMPVITPGSMSQVEAEYRKARRH